jgi:hypothetical protein
VAAGLKSPAPMAAGSSLNIPAAAASAGAR